MERFFYIINLIPRSIICSQLKLKNKKREKKKTIKLRNKQNRNFNNL